MKVFKTVISGRGYKKGDIHGGSRIVGVGKSGYRDNFWVCPFTNAGVKGGDFTYVYLEKL